MTTFAYVVVAPCGCRVAVMTGDGPATARWLLAQIKTCAYILRLPDCEAGTDDCTHERIEQLKLI